MVMIVRQYHTVSRVHLEMESTARAHYSDLTEVCKFMIDSQKLASLQEKWYGPSLTNRTVSYATASHLHRMLILSFTRWSSLLHNQN